MRPEEDGSKNQVCARWQLLTSRIVSGVRSQWLCPKPSKKPKMAPIPWYPVSCASNAKMIGDRWGEKELEIFTGKVNFDPGCKKKFRAIIVRIEMRHFYCMPAWNITAETDNPTYRFEPTYLLGVDHFSQICRCTIHRTQIRLKQIGQLQPTSPNHPDSASRLPPQGK